MGDGTDGQQRGSPWAWLLPSLLLLGGMAIWGAVRYPELPGRVPAHIGPGGVDAWADKSVWAVFVPVFAYAGITVIVVACAAAAARATPLDELPESQDRWDRAAAVMNGRPATAASVERLVRALLVMNTALGVALLPLCWVQWRGTQTAAVPGWLLPVILGLFLLSLVPLGVAWWRDAEERKARSQAP